MSGIRQSKITKGTVLASLGGKGLRKRDGQIGPVNPLRPTDSPLTSSFGRFRRGKVKIRVLERSGMANNLLFFFSFIFFN